MALSQFSFTKQGDPGMAKFARDRRLAEVLAQQALTPDPSQMAGGYVVRQSALNPLAKMAQALASRKIDERADTGERDYVRQQGEDRARMIAEAMRAGQGTPTQAEIPAPPEELGGGPGRPEVPGVAPDPMRAYMMLAGAPDPMLQQFGITGMMKDFDGPTRVDLGDRIGLYKNGVLVGEIKKGATPDAQLRETGAMTRHQTPSGTAVLGEQGAMQRHQTPSGSAILGEQGSMQRHVTPSGSAQLGASVTMRGQNLTDARSREANDINRQAGRTQIINDPVQGPIAVDKGTSTATPVRFQNGQPVLGEVPAKAAANSRDVQMLLQEAQANISRATGSYVGAGIDQLARVFGAATDGSIAIGNLKAIEGALMSKMPRMEGPQSNYDVQAYRQAVGDIGDPTVPNKQKAAAVETVKQLQMRYSSNAGANAGGASGGWSGMPSTSDIDAELARRGGR